MVSIPDVVAQSTDRSLKNKDLLAVPAMLVTQHLDTLNFPQFATPSRGASTKFDDQAALYLLRLVALIRHSVSMTWHFNPTCKIQTILHLQALRSLGFSLDGFVPCLVFKDLLPDFPNLKKLLDVSYISSDGQQSVLIVTLEQINNITTT